jgi:hypothetical protein
MRCDYAPRFHPSTPAVDFEHLVATYLNVTLLLGLLIDPPQCTREFIGLDELDEVAMIFARSGDALADRLVHTLGRSTILLDRS